MQGKTLLFGNGASSVPKVYMTGLMRVLYMYGIIGTAVLFITFVSFMAKGRNNFTICACIIYLGLMCVANLFSFIALIFWLCILSASVIKNQTMEKKTITLDDGSTKDCFVIYSLGNEKKPVVLRHSLKDLHKYPITFMIFMTL